MNEDKVNLSIGSDPELIIFNDKGQIVHANTYDKSFNLNSEIGYDGHQAILELRPKPKNCPIEHYNEIKTVMKRLGKLMKTGYEVKAGSYQGGKEIGGHIHFGTKPTTDITRALNYHLAVTLMMLEDPERAKIRRRRYGNINQTDVIRNKSYGFEYRPLASWLVDKIIAKGTLCLAYTIVYEYMENKNSFPKAEYDLLLDPNKYNICDKKYYKRFMKHIFSNIVCMKLYPKYSTEINALFKRVKDVVDDKVSGWSEHTDIIKNWGVKDLNTYNLKIRPSKAANLSYILKKVLISKDDISNKTLLVYGLSKSRGEGYDIVVSRESVKKIILKEFPTLNINIASVGIGAEEKYSIGFSYPMRTEIDGKKHLKDTCVLILQYTIDNFSQILNDDKISLEEEVALSNEVPYRPNRNEEEERPQTRPGLRFTDD